MPIRDTSVEEGVRAFDRRQAMRSKGSGIGYTVLSTVMLAESGLEFLQDSTPAGIGAVALAGWFGYNARKKLLGARQSSYEMEQDDQHLASLSQEAQDEQPDEPSRQLSFPGVE